MTYIIVDAANMFFRARHVVRGDLDDKIGMALHIIFSSINKAWRDFGGTHVVVAFEGRSWRKDFYGPYKAHRKVARDAMTPKEQEEDEAFFKAFDEFRSFLHERTNVTVLQAPGCEADDFIARWIQTHPDDKHVIISSDSDFYQLLRPNVSQYNGITSQHITLEGIFNDKGKPVVDKKTGEQKTVENPEWILFEKCIRGDTSDNIFSAYPGARKKGSKNSVGMMEAFEDRNGMGFNWNNFMLQRWTDHEGNEHVVRDDYRRNKTLIDLTAQPDEIKAALDAAIVEAVQAEHKRQVGIHLMRYCGQNNLVRMGEQADDHAKYLGASYAQKAESR
jgi:5'-3' exonuclease